MISLPVLTSERLIKVSVHTTGHAEQVPCIAADMRLDEKCAPILNALFFRVTEKSGWGTWILLPYSSNSYPLLREIAYDKSASAHGASAVRRIPF
jgi:hypothetical protein